MQPRLNVLRELGQRRCLMASLKSALAEPDVLTMESSFAPPFLASAGPRPRPLPLHWLCLLRAQLCGGVCGQAYVKTNPASGPWWRVSRRKVCGRLSRSVFGVVTSDLREASVWFQGCGAQLLW